MKSATQSNFHIPLTPQLHERLRIAARRQHLPATQVARQAIEYWLDEQEALSVREEIAAYAAAVAGTSDDLDEALENAGLEFLADSEGKS